MQITMKQRIATCFGILFVAFTLAACEPISEPWLSKHQERTLENQRERSDEQKQVLRQRLDRAGSDR